MRSWAVFKDPLQAALHTLKYKRNFGLGQDIARQAAELFDTMDWKIDILVPIPLSAKRAAERGYNQVALIAKPLAALRGFRYRPDALRRTRDTRSQVGLTAAQRKENVHLVFEAASSTDIAGKTILLMDDVITTGATIGDAARALRAAGAQQIYAFSIARAVRMS
jgi:ComF family protein